MPKLGKESYIVQLLAKKTKIKPQDVFDILTVLYECATEAFFEEGPEEKERVHFGMFAMYWRNTNLGPGIVLEPTETFLKCIAKVKYEQRTLLATNLYKKMLPINRERVSQKFESPKQNFDVEKPQNPHRQANYAEKAKENRRKLKEKRKKQKEMLKNSIP